MKHCSHKRKTIALLALDEVAGREAEELRSHLQSCEGCRRYFEEISTVTKKIATVEMSFEVEASEAFHREVMARVRGAESKTLRGIARGIGQNWRVVLPVTVSAGCAVLLLWVRIQAHVSNVMPKPIAPEATHVVAARAANANADVPPTLGNYQMAANQSLQTFDTLLNREAMKTIPAGPIYTVAELTMADGGQ